MSFTHGPLTGAGLTGMNGVTGKWKNQSEGKVEKPREGRVREGGLDAPVTVNSHRRMNWTNSETKVTEHPHS